MKSIVGHVAKSGTKKDVTSRNFLGFSRVDPDFLETTTATVLRRDLAETIVYEMTQANGGVSKQQVLFSRVYDLLPENAP
ncbi:MAG: hypothetical protein AAF562_05005 [Pseudomonadota bacterium]